MAAGVVSAAGVYPAFSARRTRARRSKMPGSSKRVTHQLQVRLLSPVPVVGSEGLWLHPFNADAHTLGALI